MSIRLFFLTNKWGQVRCAAAAPSITKIEVGGGIREHEVPLGQEMREPAAQLRPDLVALDSW